MQAEDKAIRMILTDIREEDIAVGDIIYKQ
jgi:hypothetical protein